MTDNIVLRDKGQHLTDIEITKILGLAKAGESH